MPAAMNELHNMMEIKRKFILKISENKSKPAYSSLHNKSDRSGFVIFHRSYLPDYIHRRLLYSTDEEPDLKYFYFLTFANSSSDISPHGK